MEILVVLIVVCLIGVLVFACAPSKGLPQEPASEKNLNRYRNSVVPQRQFQVLAATDPSMYSEPIEPLMQQILNQCIDSGNIVTANMHDDGSIEIHEHQMSTASEPAEAAPLQAEYQDPAADAGYSPSYESPSYDGGSCDSGSSSDSCADCGSCDSSGSGD